ncbi:hypothetical protein RvY_04486 [Ramazzottius varieornatus]|uniref:G-protein coupled receptors family 1 profile domain-containing protein n=1 Tax=Ramazzottius varieornatus TaxID=947166 RepID=A0A1D1V106_RAMVA|nr:hypothetical protein RvY_04486 [Ramazzottius varieornatus]
MPNLTVSQLSVDTVTNSTVFGSVTSALSSWILAVLIALMFVTISANFLILLVFVKNSRLRNPFNTYLFSLAFSDLLVGIFAMPFYTAYLHAGGTLNTLHCSIWMFFDYFATEISLWTLAVISLDRVWAVTWPVSYRKHNTTVKSLSLLGTAWVLAFCVVLPGFLTTRNLNMDKLTTNVTGYSDQCSWDIEGMPLWAASINVIALNDFTPCLLTVLCYIITVAKIFQMSRMRTRVVVGPSDNAQQAGPKRSSRSEKKEKQAFFLLTLLICSIIVMWTPWFFYFLWTLATGKWNDTGATVTYWLAYSMSTVNPLLFNVANDDVHSAIRELFGLGSKRRPVGPPNINDIEIETVHAS